MVVKSVQSEWDEKKKKEGLLYGITPAPAQEREKEKGRSACYLTDKALCVMKAIFFISRLTPEDSGEEIRAK